MLRTRKTLLALACATALLTACGGGSSAGTPVSTAQVLTGTAAGGAGLTGSVTVKDADGVTRTASITGGAYSIDVSGLRAPFVLRASGDAGGSHYEIHSLATSADVNGTVNITPLTDLIVANVAGKLAANFFDQPSFANVTPESINAQETALKQRLQTVLTALGVDSAIDLLHTQFTPDHSGLDAALDVLRVSVDESTNVATITNILSQEAITDDVTTTTDTQPLPLANPDALNSGVTDLQAVAQAMTAFSAHFANGLPQASELAPLVANGFLHNDADKTAFITELSNDPDNVGIQLTNIQLQSLEGDIAVISFEARNSSGKSDGVDFGFKLKKVNGQWLLLGNQHKLEVEGRPTALRTVQNNGEPHLSTGFDFSIRDEDESNSTGVNRAVITGPGLPPDGLVYSKPEMGGNWQTGFVPPGAQMMVYSSYFPLAGDDAIQTIPLNAKYMVKLYAGDQLFDTYYVRMQQRPYSNAQLSGVDFPVIDASTLAQFAGYTGGPLNLSGTLPATVGAAWAGLGLDGDFADTRLNVTDGHFSTQALSLTPRDSVSWRNLRVTYRESGDREVTAEYMLNVNNL